VTGTLRAGRLTILNNSALFFVVSPTIGVLDLLPNCSVSAGDNVTIDAQTANLQGNVLLGRFGRIRGGDLRFTSSTGRFTMNSNNNGPSIIASGAAQFAGSLVIIYSQSIFGRSTVTSTQVVQVAGFSSSSGAFSSVSAISSVPNSTCDIVTAGQPTTSGSSLSGSFSFFRSLSPVFFFFALLKSFFSLSDAVGESRHKSAWMRCSVEWRLVDGSNRRNCGRNLCSCHHFVHSSHCLAPKTRVGKEPSSFLAECEKERTVWSGELKQGRNKNQRNMKNEKIKPFVSTKWEERGMFRCFC
jgi:hypothetical protein